MSSNLTFDFEARNSLDKGDHILAKSFWMIILNQNVFVHSSAESLCRNVCNSKLLRAKILRAVFLRFYFIGFCDFAEKSQLFLQLIP